MGTPDHASLDPASSDAASAGRERSSALKIALIYLIAAGLWIICSDSVLSWLHLDSERLIQVSVFKGWIFVTVTALLLYLLVRRELHRQHRAETASREQRDVFASVIDSCDEPMFVKDTSGRYTFVNKAALRSMGVRPEQAIGKTAADLFDPAYAAEVKAVDERVMRTGHAEHYERRIPGDPSGKVLLVNRSPIIDAAGRTLGVMSISHDITTRKKAEDALREREERFRALVENSFDVIALLDAQGKVLYVSPSGARVRGFAPEEIIGQVGMEHLHPDDRAQAEAGMQAMLANPDQPIRYELRIRHKNGSWLWAESVTRNLLDNPAVGAIVVNWRDVTDRKRTEEAHEKISAFREAIIRTAAEGICVCRAAPAFPYVNFTVWNQRMIDLTGYTIDEINRQGWYQSVYRDPAVQNSAMERMQRMYAGDHLKGEEWEITCKDGSRKTIAISTSMVQTDEGEPAAVAMMQDVSERHRSELALRRSYELERLLFRELDHRVRNNLASLMSLIEITRRSTRDADAFAESIGGRVGAMAGVHTLLSSSHWSALDIRELVAAIVPRMHAGRFDLSGPPVAIPTRQITALSMVLHELTTNSAKHGVLGSPAGRVSLSWRLESAGGEPPRLTLDWIESGGPPIPRQPEPGTGTELIRGLASAELRGEAELRFPRDGARHTLTMVLDQHSGELEQFERDAPPTPNASAASDGRRRR